MLFFSFFIYFYKASGQFRKLTIAAFTTTTIVFSSGLPPAHATGRTDAFTPKQQNKSRPTHRSRSGFFSGSGSDPNKPDDSDPDSGSNSFSQFPKVASIEETENEVREILNLLHQLKEDSDTEDTEFNQQIGVFRAHRSILVTIKRFHIFFVQV